MHESILEQVHVILDLIAHEQTDDAAGLAALIAEKAADPGFECFHAAEITADMDRLAVQLFARAFAVSIYALIAKEIGLPNSLDDLSRKPLATIRWYTRPEVDILYTEVPAPFGYEGEIFKSWNTGQPSCWGPMLAKFAMCGVLVPS